MQAFMVVRIEQTVSECFDEMKTACYKKVIY